VGVSAELNAAGQAEAHFFYPAVTDAELADQDQLITGYRRSMGRTRMLYVALGVGALTWLVEYVRRGRGKA
jgi:hypothetical protein